MFRILAKSILVATLAAAMVPLGSANASGFRVLYEFGDNAHPSGALLLRDATGNLYGTAASSGGAGDVFELAPDGTFNVLYAFQDGTDGESPMGLVRDNAGNFYGTTNSGGGNGNGCDELGCGTVFKLVPGGTLSVLHTFNGGKGGGNPQCRLVSDGDGNFYGTTPVYGAHRYGTVFEVSPTGFKILYSFAGHSDGAYPEASLIRDSAGNLYGTTERGGDSYGLGTVFKVGADGTETVLYSFRHGVNDGLYPTASLIEDQGGDLYGTTSSGGKYGHGTVFELTSDGTEKILYAFRDGRDGAIPYGGLIADSAGNLYGTTYDGGDSANGTVFKLAPDGTETVLHRFSGGNDGAHPDSSLIADRKGRLYGTTTAGGTVGGGTVFRLDE